MRYYVAGNGAQGIRIASQSTAEAWAVARFHLVGSIALRQVSRDAYMRYLTNIPVSSPPSAVETMSTSTLWAEPRETAAA